MSLIRTIITSFNGGELSNRMSGRVDTAIYNVGLATCENFVPTVEGPLVKRPGFEYIQPAAASASWLGKFRFNLTQDYVIEWSEGKLRFYTNGIRIETSPGVPYEVDVPYTAAEAPFVSFEQSFDRLYLDHPNHPPAALTRTSGSTFSYAALALTNGPFADANKDQTRTLTASATTGSGITLTASSPIFDAGRIGSTMRIEALDFSTINAWEAGMNGINVGRVIRSDGKAYTATATASDHRTGTIQPTHTEGAAWDGATGKDINDKGPYGVQWAYRHDRFGIVTITAVGGGGYTATADVVRTLPDSVASVPTWRWSHGAFSISAGWPNLVRAWQGRLIHIKQFDVLGSVAGDYLNHATFTASGLLTGDLAFRRTISAQDPVLWALGDRKLIVGTASSEIAIGAINAAQAISGDNIEAVPQSFYGSAAVFPLQIGTAGVFVQRGGRKLRQAEYDFARDRYVAENMTVWSRNITGTGSTGGVIQLAFQKEPEELLFGVRRDGQMLAHPHSPEQEIKGFGRIVHSDGAGKIWSGVTISSADGLTDEVWALVLRDGVKGVERMKPWREDGDPIYSAFYVDSGTTAIAGIGQTHFSGATQLAGKAVAVLADGGVVPGITVDNTGAFDIPASSIPTGRPYIITVGLRYTATAVTLRPELRANNQTSQGRAAADRETGAAPDRNGGYSRRHAGRQARRTDRPAGIGQYGRTRAAILRRQRAAGERQLRSQRASNVDFERAAARDHRGGNAQDRGDGMTVTFERMTAADAMTIERQPSQRVQLGLDASMTIEVAADLAAGGEAWTAWRGCTPVACVGLRETFPGVQAVAWAILSRGLRGDHVAITRFTARRIAASPYRRIEAICIAAVDAEAILSSFPGLDPAQLLEAVLCVRGPQARWAEALGLTPSAVLRCFGAASETHILFERIG